MFNKIENIQSEIILYSLEDLVPQESIYRKIDKYIDFTFIYDKVKDLYCQNNGRNCVDPVVLFKLVFIQTIDGIKSMRKTCEKIKVDLEYRWFLGIPLGKSLHIIQHSVKITYEGFKVQQYLKRYLLK